MTTSIERLRSALGLSQEAFGDAIGVSQPTISAIEHGRLKLSARLALLIRDTWPDRVAQDGGVEDLLRGAR